MFDVSFFEFLIIFVFALIVIGPERLPKVARIIGRLVGRLRNYFTQAKAEINRGLEVDAFEKVLGEAESKLNSLHDQYLIEMGVVVEKFKVHSEPTKNAVFGEESAQPQTLERQEKS